MQVRALQMHSRALHHGFVVIFCTRLVDRIDFIFLETKASARLTTKYSIIMVFATMNGLVGILAHNVNHKSKLYAINGVCRN